MGVPIRGASWCYTVGPYSVYDIKTLSKKRNSAISSSNPLPL